MRNELVEEHLNPLYLEAHARTRAAVGELGATNYFELYKGFGFDLEALAEQCRSFLASTERVHEKTSTSSSARASACRSPRPSAGTRTG